VGGSSWSAAARCGTKIATATVKAIRLTNLSACFLITTFSPETRAEQDWACAAYFPFGPIGVWSEMQSLSMPCILDQSVSGILGMSNQKRPDLPRAIKHLRKGRVVRGEGLGVAGIGTTWCT